MSSNSQVNSRAMVKGVIFICVLLIALVGVFKLMENVDAESIMVVQSPVSGNLTWYTNAGLKYQGFGKVTVYPKRSIYTFEKPVRFNDGGHGTMFGSIQYEMPLDKVNLTALHTRFGSAEAIQKQIIETITDKSIYMTGPLMSSKESYAEKRNYLIHYVEDQISNGVYKTTQKEVRVQDAMTGVEKTVAVVEIVMGPDGMPQRQEEAVLAKFGIKAFNFAINKLPYDETVEGQIKAQQAIAMDVQTAIADAKKAEQRAITVAKQGEADAAKSKWDQEVIKAQQVTEAQQKLAVAELDAKAALQYKNAQILRAQGDAEYKQRVMRADGGLEQKLEALVEINKEYAGAIRDHQGSWVPTVYMGGGGTTGSSGGANMSSLNAAIPMINLLTTKLAMDLGLDMQVTGKANTTTGK